MEKELEIELEIEGVDLPHNFPDFEIGDTCQLSQIWDGEGEFPFDGAASWSFSRNGQIIHKFEFVDDHSDDPAPEEGDFEDFGDWVRRRLDDFVQINDIYLV